MGLQRYEENRNLQIFRTKNAKNFVKNVRRGDFSCYSYPVLPLSRGQCCHRVISCVTSCAAPELLPESLSACMSPEAVNDYTNK